MDNSVGMNVSVSDLGLRTSRIIAGINCPENNTIKLNNISNELGLGGVYKRNLCKFINKTQTTKKIKKVLEIHEKI